MASWRNFQVNPSWNRGSVLQFLLPLVLVVTSSGSAKGEDEMCPCLPVGKCPRIYGRSAADIRELGFQEPCLQFGTVRCCGVTIRIEHEKDSERNWDSLISSPRTMETNGPDTNYSHSSEGANIVSDMPWTPNGTSTATTMGYRKTASSALTKLRRRKPTGSTQVDPAGSPMQATLKNSTQEGPRLLPAPRPNILRRFKAKVGDAAVLSRSQQTSSSSVTSGVNSPVFPRMRKQPAVVHVGIKVDSYLPGTVSGAQSVTLGGQRETLISPGPPASSNTSMVLPPLSTILNIHPTLASPLDLSLASSASAANRKLSTLPTLGNFVANKSRPAYLSRMGATKQVPAGVVGNSSAIHPDGQLSVKTGEATPPAAIKLRRPLRRRPVTTSANPLTDVPPDSSVTIHSYSSGSNSLLPESLPTVAIKIDGKEAGKSASLSRKYKKRVRIHPITTPTTTTSSPETSEHVTTGSDKEEQPETADKFQEQRPFQHPFPSLESWNQEQQEAKGDYWTNPDHAKGYKHAQQVSDDKEEEVTDFQPEQRNGPPDYHHHVHPTEKSPITVVESTSPPLTPMPYAIPQLTHSNWNSYAPPSPIRNPSDITYSMDYTMTTEEPKPATEATSAPLDDYGHRPRYPTRVYSTNDESDRKPTRKEPKYISSTLSSQRKSPSHLQKQGTVGIPLEKVQKTEGVVPITSTQHLQRSPPSSRRFKVPMNFLRPVDHPPTSASAVRNFFENAVTETGESYDIILDKESRESLKEQQRKQSNEFINHANLEQIPSSGGAGDGFHSIGESGPEETRVYAEFVEKTSATTTTSVPMPIDTIYINREEGRPKYKRIRLDPPASPSRVTIINSQKVEAEEFIREKEGDWRLSSGKSKRFKARLTPLSSSKPPLPPPLTLNTNHQSTAKFNFPPFVSRDSYGPPPPSPKTTPPPTHKSPSESAGELWLFDPKPTSAAPVHQPSTTTTTTAYVSEQISPTEIPTVPTSTTPLPVQPSWSPHVTPSEPSTANQKHSTRFTVPKTFNFDNPPLDYGRKQHNSGSNVTSAGNTRAIKVKQIPIFHDQTGTLYPTFPSAMFPNGVEGGEYPIADIRYIYHQESTTVRTIGKDGGLADNQFQKNIQPESNSSGNNSNNQGGNPSPTAVTTVAYSLNPPISKPPPSPVTHLRPNHDQGGTYINISGVGFQDSSLPRPIPVTPKEDGTPEITFSGKNPSSINSSPPWKLPGPSLNEVPNRGMFAPPAHFTMKLEQPQPPQVSREPNSATNRFQQPQFNSQQHGRFPERGSLQERNPPQLFPEFSPRPAPNGVRGQPGFVSQGGKVIPVRIHTEILSPQVQNQQGQFGAINSPGSRFPVNNPGAVAQRPTGYYQRPAAAGTDSVRYSSNQFNPSGSSGSPVQFSAKTPLHYVREYHQHHAISKEILSQLQNSIRTSRSANLTTEEIEALLEISRSPDQDVEHKMELMGPLLRKLDLEEDHDDDEARELSPRTLQYSGKDEGEEEQQRERDRTTSLKNITNELQQLNVTLPVLSREDDDVGNRTVGTDTEGPAIPDKTASVGFRAPKTIQRGFFPILPYSDKDPGITMVNVNVAPFLRTSRALRADKALDLVSLTGPRGQQEVK